MDLLNFLRGPMTRMSGMPLVILKVTPLRWRRRLLAADHRRLFGLGDPFRRVAAGSRLELTPIGVLPR